MRNGQAFVGFREATINFPPTFKYDVLRTTRHKRRRSKHTHATVGVVAPLSQELADASERRELEDYGQSEVSSEDDTNGELASVISSGTTTYSQHDHASDEDNDSGAESDYLRRRMSYPQRSAGLVKRISMSAAQRAKSKWAELINAPTSRYVRPRRTNAPTPQSRGNSKSPRSVQTTPLLGRRSTSSIDQPPDDILASSPPLRAHVPPSPSCVGDGTAEAEDDKGVYDSSSKQRVPSWCDRILFKSTVMPDPEPEEDTHAAPQRNAVSLLAHAWRSFRRSSTSSLRSTHNAPANSTTVPTSSSPSNPIPSTSPADSEPSNAAQPHFPTPYVPRRKRVRPHSIDVAALAPPSQPTSLTSARPGTSSGVQTQRPSGIKGSTPPNLPPRKPTAPPALAISSHQHHREPAAPFASNTRGGPSPTSSSDGPSSVTAPHGSGGSGRGHPRWRLMSFLSRDAEAARDATGPSDHVTTSASAAAATATVNADADSSTRMPMTTAPSSSSPVGEPDGASAAAGPSRPRKGDVVCLSYRTLDDRAMRRLEGRSDHRPVIGVYAIYV
jgi:endonuclease/exonuclease/phosphatase family protein